MMFAVAALALLVAIGLALARAIAGPTVFDRALAGNSIGTLAMMMLAVFGFLTGRPEFLRDGAPPRRLEDCRWSISVGETGSAGGEPRRTRTSNPQIKSLLLYHLSYRPTPVREFRIPGRASYPGPGGRSRDPPRRRAFTR